jgi:hypothetical protein
MTFTLIGLGLGGALGAYYIMGGDRALRAWLRRIVGR